MLKGMIVLLLFQLLGETIAELTHTPVPGTVIGMLLLLVGLLIKRGPSAQLQSTSQTLIQYLSLLFLPAGVGLFFLPEAIRQHWLAILAAIVAGTFISMLFCAWLVRLLHRDSQS